jgi:Putative peptidoglycan binding domain
LKGFFVFCGVCVTIGFFAVTLPYLNDRDRAFEQRFVGALDFTDQTIEATFNLHASLYEPSFAPGSKPGQWALSGLLVSKDSLGGEARRPFRAVLESVCSAAADPSCWRLVDLRVDGQVIKTVSAAGATPKPAAGAGASGTGALDVALENDSVLVPTLLFEDDSANTSKDTFEATPVQVERPVEAVVSSSDETAASAQVTAAAKVDGGESTDGSADMQFSTQDLIRFIQDALTRLRYDPGPVDGKVGSRTASAIKAYQHDYSLVPDGRPTLELLRHMRGKLKDLQQQSGGPSNGSDQPSG